MPRETRQDSIFYGFWHAGFADVVIAAVGINRLLEGWIRRCPEQYLWVHRRFKTRPDGEPQFYGQDARPGAPTP